DLHREAARIARGVDRALAAGHGGEAGEYRGALADFGEQFRPCVLRERIGQFEVPVRRRTARMHDALGNALVVEVHDLFAEDEVLQQGRTARALPERILVVGDRHALVGGQPRALAAGLLLVFAAAAAWRVGLWIGIGAATHGSRGLAFGGPCVTLWLFTGCGGGGGPGRGHARAPAGVSTRWWRERRERDAWEKAGAPRQSRQRCMSRDASITKRERALEQAAALG